VRELHHNSLLAMIQPRVRRWVAPYPR